MSKQFKRYDLAAWASFERFNEIHKGAVPSWLAAEYLRMTPQGVFQAAERGWIAFFQHGRNRLYSRADLVKYRWTVSRKYKDTRPAPPYKNAKPFAL
jgi:hypothetical protein